MPNQIIPVGGFNTGEIHPWNEPQPKNSKEITFSKTFVAPPRIPLGLNFIDISCKTNPRINATITDLTKKGCRVHIDTWGDTTLYTGGCNFLELSPGHLEFQCGEFSTLDDHPWDKPQLTTKRRINFAYPYATPPKIVVFLKAIDMAYDKNYRLKTKATDIDTKGFTIHVETWGDSVLYSATAGWIAYPEDREYVASGVYNTLEQRPWNQPQSHNSKKINFGCEFWKTPKVFVAINALDLDYKANMRLEVNTENVTTTGMTGIIKSWGDTVLYSAALSYLAVV